MIRVLITLFLLPVTFALGTEPHLFNLHDYGAAGDGVTLDTDAINKAIAACSETGGGQVFFPPGRYLSGTVHLRSHTSLFLSAGAALVGTTNLALYEAPAIPSFMPEARWGKWHRGLVIGEGLEDVMITGPGMIDGNKVFDPTGEEHRRGPHTITFVNCRRFALRDFSIQDSANYAIFFQASDDVDVRNVKITGGWDGIHFRGAAGQWCHNVNIIGCQFYTGDDSIAGRYWENVVVSGCVLNSACNGVRLIGPATRLTISHCLFYGPGREPHRSSARHNMLSGIILQPGAWDKCDGLLDEVFLSENTMKDVSSPVTIWTKSGNPVGRVTISGLDATGVYRAALSAESWSDVPITNVILRNATIEFSGGGSADLLGKPVTRPGVDVRPLPSWGIYARNVENLTCEDVRLAVAKEDPRPVVAADRVTRLTLDNVRYPHFQGVAQPVMLTNVATVIRGE